MPLLACGLNHESAPIAVREQIALHPDRAKKALRDLLDKGAANEALILSTCNRVEFYSDTANQDILIDWISHTFNLSPLQNPHWYFHYDHKAVTHIMRVASGIDSMILGEPQILGQMKQAYHLACEVGAVGKRLQRLFQTVFAVSKQVRNDTSIGVNSISMGCVAINLAKHIFSDLSKRCVLLIGAGEIIELTAAHLYSQGVKRIIVANRSTEKAEQLAKRFYGHWISIVDVPLYLKEADIVIAATSSDLPILGKGAVERAVKARKHKPIFMLDLGVPRDIEPEVKDLEDVYLYNIDDLKSIAEENRQHRASGAKQAEMIIEIQALHLMRELQTLDANTLIRDYREKMEIIRDAELAKALANLNEGANPQQVLNQFAQNLTNKMLHTPSSQLRQIAYDGRFDLLALARNLFDI